MSSIAALRELLEERFPGAQPVAPGAAAPLATGVAELDGMLPEGGLPRGRLTLWRPGGGATAVLLEACRATVARGERAAWVDASRTLTGVVALDGPALLRPRSERGALECAEELLRSGGFALVVLGGARDVAASGSSGASGASTGSGSSGAARRWRRRRARGGRDRVEGRGAAADSVFVRLSRAAREGGAAFAVLAERSPVAALRVTSSIDPEGYRWRRGPFGEAAVVEAATVRVRASTPGWSGEARFEVPVREVDVRIAPEPGLPDRRGVEARKAGWRPPEEVRRGSSAEAS